MLIAPAPRQLLLRLCDALEAAAGDARQLRAGVWVLRDLAKRVDERATAIQADIEDMRAVIPHPRQRGDDDEHLQFQAQLLALQQTRRNDPVIRRLHLRILQRERSLLGPPGGNPSLKATP